MMCFSFLVNLVVLVLSKVYAITSMILAYSLCRNAVYKGINPSLSPLPDIMARKGKHSYAFEVKNVSYYAYFPKQQIDKLFRFLNELMSGDNEQKHAVIAAHLGKKWLFKEIGWTDWEKDKLPDKIRILKRDRGNFSL